ncbi:polyhomeotic-like protein 3 isoform X2 [Narcine bancroftii]|uniref:polyhomeotic-like protein 3 isoform X2 n=1 Tax=Narcine bancroftii TaxID=1343680 RepID=UPI003831F3CD
MRLRLREFKSECTDGKNWVQIFVLSSLVSLAPPPPIVTVDVLIKSKPAAMESDPSTTTSTTTTTASTSSRTQAPQISVYSSSDRQAVQVIQQALHRQPSTAAQYLQQMYAAQQQHLMLQTAALQQQHLSSTQLQSLATVQQAGGRQSSSPTGSVSQSSSVAQTSINLAPSSAAPQLMSRNPTSNTTSSGITQQAMLLGNTTPTLTASQAQMYLRAQMVQNLAVRSQQLSALAAPSPQSVPLKGTCQAQPLSMSQVKAAGQGATSKASQPDLNPEGTKKGESVTPSSPEPRVSTVTRLQLPVSTQQLIAPAPYSPMPQHPLMKHQSVPKTHHQLLVQHRQQLQPLALQAQPSEPDPPQHCPPVQSQGQALVQSSPPSQHCISTQAHSQPLSQPSAHSHPQGQQHTVVVSPVPPRSLSPPSTIIVQPSQHPPQAPSHRSPVAQIGPLRPVRPGPPRPQDPSPAPSPQEVLTSAGAHLQRLPLQSVRALAVAPEIVSSTQVLPQTVLHSREQLPAAQALIQMPFQALPPPQTIAVNLQVHTSPPVDVPLVCSLEDACDQEMREEQEECFAPPRGASPPTSHSDSSISAVDGEAETAGDICQEPAVTPVVTSAGASVIRSSVDPLQFSSPSSPIVPPAKLKPSGAAPNLGGPAGIDNKPPQAIVKPQILTHVIEGFVIQEGLEPFPVSRSSLLTEQPIKQKVLSEGPATPPSSDQLTGELPSDTNKPLEESLDSDVDDLTGEEGMEGSDPDMLKCEFCGKMDYAHKFRRSKRFCSMSCAKRYNVGCSKRMGLFKSDKNSRWNRKPEAHSFSRRGRRANVLEGASGDHFMRQTPVGFPAAEESTVTSNPPLPEEAVSVAMTTRRRQNEREREMRELRMREAPDCGEMLHSDPATWTVDHVWEFIHSLPGCKDIAEEFRSQEIDGQALLLLKEDHLMSAMNIKLGPALKICARINMLKES